MGGFPIHWEQEVPSLDWIVGECPFSDDEIEEYLQGGRHFWLRTASNEAGEQWYVVIGTGKSPFNEATKMRRWMYAEENDLGLTPVAFLLEAIEQQHDADVHFSK